MAAEPGRTESSKLALEPSDCPYGLAMRPRALENVLLDRSHGRWRITFVFGLVHGFGFASILRAMHLPAEGMAVSLVTFNLGVEAGQIVVVLLAYPLIIAIQRAPQRRAIVATASSVILTVALYWFVERAFFA